MKTNLKKLILSITLLMFLLFILMFYNNSNTLAYTDKPKTKLDTLKEIIHTNINGKGIELNIDFIKGKQHNHPLFAIWIEDADGNYIQTLYVSKSIAKGVFERGKNDKGKWQPGEIRRPAALPYWAHKRNVKEADGLYIPTPKTPIPDAYTGATPAGNFRLNTKTDQIPPKQFKLLLELNQSWDWNEYWTNAKFPDDKEYKTSSQPAIVYATNIDLTDIKSTYTLELIGHSHYNGSDGSLTTDLSTITTAKNIAQKITVSIKR